MTLFKTQGKKTKLDWKYLALKKKNAVMQLGITLYPAALEHIKLCIGTLQLQ